ncbi:MAG: hypothetical protein M3N19_06060 [Candidatus Eremiobacteraeota bacterium]|nr:hypothetical protein [Candidatus Eremiobacteraeota bacterium]
MEQFVLNLLHAAAWLFMFIFLFALIGVAATIRWIMNLITGTERAVATGVHNVENKLHHHD